MLIKTDANQEPIKQWDQVITTRHTHEEAEKLHVQQEQAPLTPDGAGMRLDQTEQRMGRPLSSGQFKKRLLKCNQNFHFEVSKADSTKIGIYLVTEVRGIPGIRDYKDRLFICGMENGISPEFSIIEAEVKGIPDPEAPDGMKWINTMKCERRGWRSVLAALLRGRFITLPQIDKYFEADKGRESQRWHALLNPSPVEVLDATNYQPQGDEDGKPTGSADKRIVVA